MPISRWIPKFNPAPPTLDYSRVFESPAAKALRLALAAQNLVNDATVSPPLPSGDYLFMFGPANTNSTNTHGNDVLRLASATIPDLTISRLGIEVTGAGSAGSVMRLGVYADNGRGKPSTLIVDAGTVPTDAIAVVEVALASNLTLPSGTYHFGACLQGSPATAPYIRTISVPPASAIINLSTLGGSVGSNVSILGHTQSAVSGALPSTYTGTGWAGTAPRIFVRIA